MNNPEEESGDYERSSGTNSPIDFQSSQLIIPDITRTMEVLGDDIFSSFEIIVWLPEDDSAYADTLITTSKTLWRGKISLLNGEVILEGDFPTTGWTLTQGSDGQWIVDISGMNIEVSYSASVMPETDIEVLMVTDGGVDDSELLTSVINSTEQNENIDLTLSPVPTGANLSINYQSEISGYTVVSIYSSVGVHLADVFSGILPIDEHVFNHTMTGIGLLQNEVYYIFISVGNKVYVKAGVTE